MQIQDAVRDALMWDPEITSTDIGVTVTDGVVTLRGTVVLSSEQWAAWTGQIVAVIRSEQQIVLHDMFEGVPAACLMRAAVACGMEHRGNGGGRYYAP